MTETSSNNLFANLGAQGDTPDLEDGVTTISELEMLKNRARVMGIPFSNAIKVEGLRAKIQAKLDGDPENQELSEQNESQDASEGKGSENGDSLDNTDESSADPEPSTAPPVAAPVKAAPVAAPVPTKKLTLREQLVAREMALVRCRITNMDPKKANLPGEIFTVANEFLGTVKKYIPYGEATDDGYHIPMCLYTNLVERTFVSIKTIKNKNGRGTTTTTSDAREFAIEVLPPLTVTELGRLASAQAAAAGE